MQDRERRSVGLADIAFALGLMILTGELYVLAGLAAWDVWRAL
jgi:hypothetical protein